MGRISRRDFDVTSSRERGRSCLFDLNETLISGETAVRPSVAVAGREKGGEPETSAELTAIDRRENYARDSDSIPQATSS